MSVQSILVEYAGEQSLFTSSAILLDKRWIIFPAASFLISLSSKKHIPIELQHLETSRFYRTNYLSLTPDNVKIVQFSDVTKKFTYHLAKYIGIFSCKNIKETSNFPLGCGDSSNSDLDFNSFLSLFLILDLNWNSDFVEKQLFFSIESLLKNCAIAKINRGNFTCIESTPFGSRDLMGSYSQGIICNCVGKNDCFVLTDAPTAPGSEGAPIFTFRNNNLKSAKIPVGIVISSLNWWRGEHIGLTLGTMLVPLLSQLLPRKWSLKNMLFSNKNSVINTIDKSIVQVFCGNGWGTGILIDKNKGLFITGSHVVKSGRTESITLKWRNKQFSCSLIYRTENSPVYDVAVLHCSPDNVEQMTALKFATRPAVKGENVIAAGYPIFNSDNFIFPVVTKGNISLVDNCIMQTTCCILAGSSGGAIMRENGELVGVIVCHTTASFKNETVVYPKINMGIPIAAISKPLLDYIKNNDVTVLRNLESNDVYIRNKWHLFQAKL